jgi:stress response protein SCP2
MKKNRTRSFISIFFLVVFWGILFSSCDNSYNNAEISEQDEMVLVRIGLSGKSGRSILPDMPEMDDIALFELWGTGSNLDEYWLIDFEDINNASIFLKSGTWNFTLYAYIYDSYSDNYYCIYSSVKKGVVVTSGQSQTIEFTLLPFKDYEGWAYVTIELPPDIDVASVETIIDGETLDPPLEIDDGIIEYLEKLEAGEYFITFVLKDSNELPTAVISEILVIRNGVWSTKTFVLSDKDFNCPPDTPSNFKVTAYTDGKITFTWESISRNETGFILYDGTTEYAINAGSTSYTFPVASPSGMTFTLKAVNDFGESEKAEYTAAIPEKPSGLRAEALLPFIIKLSWEADNKALNYIIQRSTSATGTYTQIATTAEISYTDTNLLLSTTYYYKVIAHNIVGDSPVSNVVSAQTGNSIQMTLDTWADGNITTSSGEQWFRFTATAATQYLHINFGTLTNLYVQVYNTSGTIVGSQTNLSGSTKSTFRSVTSGQVYYIKVTPYSSSGSGTYQIAFNTSSTAPTLIPWFGSTVTTLTVNNWFNGNITSSGGVQWFKFTATATTQYLHVNFGTLTNLYIQVYNSSGATVGSQTNLSGSTKSTSRSVTSGQLYYIKVTPYNSSGSGSYQIAFNTSSTAPLPWAGADIETITHVNTIHDSDGITTPGGVRWYKFNAMAATQYLNFSFGTLTSLYVQLYNSSGATVGSQTNINGSTKSTSRSLTVGQEYYIKVWPYASSGSGTYMFSLSNNSPSTLPDF